MSIFKGALGGAIGAVGGSMLGLPPSVGASLGSALLGASSERDAQRRAEQQAQLERDTQREFAQNGIRWKVEDAKQAGIHPLYALGANTVAYNPVAINDTPSNAMANMGQDLSRAINATRTQSERDNAVNDTANQLKLTNMKLQNDLLASQIAKLQQTPNPPMPTYNGFAPTASDVGRNAIKVDPDRVTVTDANDRSRTAGTKAANMRIVVNKYGDTMVVPHGSEVADSIEAGGLPVQTEYFVKNRLYPLYHETDAWVRGLFKK
jgi:hypothetical protein